MADIALYMLTCNPLQENTYVLADKATGDAVLVDPGMYTATERAKLEKLLADKKLNLQAIWLTHSHIDHVLGLAWAIDRYKVLYFQSADDKANLWSVAVYAPNYGLHDYQPPTTDGEVIDGKTLTSGTISANVLLTPGHAAGHLAFYVEGLGVLSGDALFAGSIGRTDLPGGDFNTLAHSIRTQLYTLPDDTEVFAGHGPSTFIGREKKGNPFVRL